ncbi:hypothetical protein CHS0354_019764 [Potamilus streckersoni]|uniref:Uncharacterized protein n=1 Tax=Potamilus streckersoni TaxID=2493646 RepID=A0AAE0SAM7_9BIVA|nr:hypothetical protein CHS0354_019764 [Potamilus streckersoni]
MAYEKNKLVVAAIDFGTTYTGYAFSLKSDPMRIYQNEWYATSTEAYSIFAKAPTTVLFRPDGTFHSFGFEAEDEFFTLNETEKKAWYYFHEFKMKLYSTKNLNRNSLIEEFLGKTMPAIHVFAESIRYLKDQLEEAMQVKGITVNMKDILWVVTVPAIWSDSAKQLMREAANRAGILNEDLILALEPEAASIWCKEDPGMNLQNYFQPGRKYVLLDIGGGTTDISAHEVLEDNSLREIHRATGDALGGINVDKKFKHFMTLLFGRDVFTRFLIQHNNDYLELIRNFRIKKKTISSSQERFSIRLPSTLGEVVLEVKGCEINTLISQSKFSKVASYSSDKLKIDHAKMKEFFEDTIRGIIQCVQRVFSTQAVSPVDTILVVGGFSGSLLFQDNLKTNFPDVKIVIPKDGEMAILKGAVLLGYKPHIISERISRYTYGVSYNIPFIEGEHPEKLLIFAGGEKRCHLLFEKIIQINQSVRSGSTVIFYRCTNVVNDNEKQKALSTKVFSSTLEDPIYCTDEETKQIGEIIRSPPEGGWPDVVESRIDITAGESELRVKVFEVSTGREFESKFDFLQ